MRRFELIAPCHFGMESVLKREITDLGYDITEVADGRVTFFGDEEALCRANIFLRTAERILIKIGSFHAETFEELFQGTKNLPWEEYIPKDGKFWVAKAASVKSKLFSPSDIQSIMKKAMVERLKAQYEISWFPEDGENFPVRVFLMKDEVTVGLDSTGESLHKRGYRKLTAKAPIAENLAAALIELPHIGTKNNCAYRNDCNNKHQKPYNDPLASVSAHFFSLMTHMYLSQTGIPDRIPPNLLLKIPYKNAIFHIRAKMSKNIQIVH